jgi:hypothetical protein
VILRGVLLYLSHQQQLRRWMETSPLAARLTMRFIAGQTLEQELAVCRANVEPLVIAAARGDYQGKFGRAGLLHSGYAGDLNLAVALPQFQTSR